MTTTTELRERYEAAVKIARAEKRMRQHVFRNQPATLAAKMAEMDTLLDTLAWLKDELKPHCEPEYEQPALLDVPHPEGSRQGRRPEYR